VRYDVNSDEAQGYVIFRDGVPYQVGMRIHGPPDPRGYDNLISWLLPVDGPMSAGLAAWVAVNFSFAINEQASLRLLTYHDYASMLRA
jgi:hypothetical protein